MNSLEEKCRNHGVWIPSSFNYHDKKRLEEVSEENFKKEYSRIQDEINRVGRVNLSINHSNFS